jgi:hypothetical protein
LAMVDIELEIPRSQETDIIVPTKAVTELGRLLTDDGDVKVSVSSGQIAFDLNKTLLVSKLIEGNYPNYKQVIPGEAKERVTLERETFLNSLRRVSLLASEKSNSIKLNFSKNNIDITANTPEVGEAKESLAVQYKGRDFSIAFNPEFLMAPLRALGEDEVFLDLIDEMSPGVLKIQTPFLYVLMPMRISSVHDAPARIAPRAPVDLIAQEVRHCHPKQAGNDHQISQHCEEQSARLVAKEGRFQERFGREQADDAERAHREKFLNKSKHEHVTDGQENQERFAEAGEFAHFHRGEKPERPNERDR